MNSINVGDWENSYVLWKFETRPVIEKCQI